MLVIVLFCFVYFSLHASLCVYPSIIYGSIKSSQTLSCLFEQNLMDLKSLRHIVGVTAHDRTSKYIFHPHRKTKPPTVAAQFQVCTSAD